MGMVSGEGDVYFGRDVGKSALETFFWPAEGGQKFFLPHVSILKMLKFLWRNQIWVKNTKKVSTPDPTSPSALGCWPIHLSPVACHSGGAGGAMSYTRPDPPLALVKAISLLSQPPPTAHPCRRLVAGACSLPQGPAACPGLDVCQCVDHLMLWKERYLGMPALLQPGPKGPAPLLGPAESETACAITQKWILSGLAVALPAIVGHPSSPVEVCALASVLSKEQQALDVFSAVPWASTVPGLFLVPRLPYLPGGGGRRAWLFQKGGCLSDGRVGGGPRVGWWF